MIHSDWWIWQSGLSMIVCFKCSITANCLIPLSGDSCSERLAKNTAANAPITIEEMTIIMLVIDR